MNPNADSRRSALRSAVRYAAAAALGALVVTLGIRRGTKSAGYCPHAGRCSDCTVTARCHVFKATQPRARR